MRYTSIELAGDHARATITPADDGPWRVRVALRLPGGGGEERTVGTADAEERWAAAQWLQRALDGYRGSGGDVRDVAEALERVARA